jgi:hypothetical protein
MKAKNIFYQLSFFLLSLALGGVGVGCNPVEDDSYALGGEIVGLPADWTVTVTDNENEVIVDYAPLDNFIDGTKILAVQFSCPEAGISFVVKKGDPVEPKSAKVYRSGSYVLYVAAVTRAGAGAPKEVPFTVEKNLLLETLSESVLPEVVEFSIDDDGHKETFYKGDLYIESSSFITLAGAMESDEVIVNLDFFSRENTSTVRFLGESGVYSLYWNPVRKNVIIEPTVAIEAANGYYVLTGAGLGYPTTASSDAIKAAYGGGDGRYTTWWAPGNSIRSRVVMRKVGTDTYQATVCINSNAAFKPFSNTNWGNDSYAAENCKFSGSPILKESGDWSPNGSCDFNAYYRFILNAAQKTVDVKKVSATGEVLPDEVTPEEPKVPTAVDDSTTINLSLFENKDVNGQVMGVYTKTLKKDFSYKVAGNFDDADVLFNPDFFERTSAGSVQFLGEPGEYTLFYYKAGKVLLIAPSAPDYPDYIVATGKGFGYPVGAGTPSYIGSYPQNAAADDILRYVLFRKIADNTYQATVMIKTGEGNMEFKPYHAAGGGNVINNWGSGGEYNYDKCTFSGETDVFVDDGGQYHNWVAGANASATQPYRITVTVTGDNPKTANVTINSHTLP